MTMQRHSEALTEFKFSDAEASARGEFVGYASVFGNVDQGGDVQNRMLLTEVDYTPSQLTQAANWYLFRYSEPRNRVGSIAVSPFEAPSLATFAATVEPFDRVRVRNLPFHAPSATMDFLVESVAHSRIENDEWTVELSLSPWIPVLTLDDSTYGALDSYPLGY
jgi:hypothetical protein